MQSIADRRAAAIPRIWPKPAPRNSDCQSRAGHGLWRGKRGLDGCGGRCGLAGGAEVIGVLPEILSGSEIAHTGLTRLEVVKTMHARKARMVHLADAFLVLPGGYGTFDELMEIVTWKQLRLHSQALRADQYSGLLGRPAGVFGYGSQGGIPEGGESLASAGRKRCGASSGDGEGNDLRLGKSAEPQ